MAYTALFQRHELKYLLDPSQHEALREALIPHMEPDRWPHSSVRSLYFDTQDLVLARRSAEKPAYKEKLRLRSYGPATGDDPVFVELKKKYRGQVFKRRLQTSCALAMAWLSDRGAAPEDSQIAREIDYALSFYDSLAPALLVTYERDSLRTRTPSGALAAAQAAPCNPSSPELRITFDREIRASSQELSLEAVPSGPGLLPSSQVLMEVKCAQAVPLWLSRLFSELRIRPTSFSKYGRAWRQLAPKPQVSPTLSPWRQAAWAH